MHMRMPPLFPPQVWSVADLIDAGQPRNTNHVEAWHRRFKSVVGVSHPGVFRLIDALRREQKETELAAQALLRGQAPPPPSRARQKREEALLKLVEQRPTMTVHNFLKGVAHHLLLLFTLAHALASALPVHDVHAFCLSFYHAISMV